MTGTLVASALVCAASGSTTTGTAQARTRAPRNHVTHRFIDLSGPYTSPAMNLAPTIARHGLRSFAALGLAMALVAEPRSQPLALDAGAAGAWQKIRKLQTTASVMHTTAHPDDEHGGMLAMLSRGQGARLALLTLTRGESGDNAIGPELFDGLGLIRTEELAIAGRYYGVDRQYFTSAVDYGFSKRLDEALQKWGRDNVLGDVVRVIRIDRPLVLISRGSRATRATATAITRRRG